MPAVGRGLTKPKSLVEHLSEQAPKRPVDDILSINRYITSAKLLLKQVCPIAHWAEPRAARVLRAFGLGRPLR
jgi:hypothetical protein